MARSPWITKWHFSYAGNEWDSVQMPEYFSVKIYKDTTGQYTNDECDRCNMVEIPVPKKTLYEWWLNELQTNKEYWGEFAWEDGDWEHFVNWLTEESVPDDTNTLYYWLTQHNYYWKRLD